MDQIDFNKEEFGKTIYGVIGSLITTLIIFLISHLGNIFNLTNNDKTTSIIIWLVFLYIIVVSWSIFIWSYRRNSKEFVFKRSIRIFGIIISIIATIVIVLIFSLNHKREIPAYQIRIINKMDTVTTIFSRGEVWLTKPTSPFDQIQLYYGYFDLCQNDSIKDIKINPKDSTAVTINFKGKKALEQLVMTDELKMNLRFQLTDNTFLSIWGIPFDENTLSRTYSLLKINSRIGNNMKKDTSLTGGSNIDKTNQIINDNHLITTKIKDPVLNKLKGKSVSNKSTIGEKICEANAYTESLQYNSAIEIYRSIIEKEPKYFNDMPNKIQEAIIYYKKTMDITSECIEYKNYFSNLIKCN